MMSTDEEIYESLKKLAKDWANDLATANFVLDEGQYDGSSDELGLNYLSKKSGSIRPVTRTSGSIIGHALKSDNAMARSARKIKENNMELLRITKSQRSSISLGFSSNKV